MIFADVQILIASFLYAKKNEVLFRNAGYVASTILIRISLTLDNIYGRLIAIGAVATGIAVQAISGISAGLILRMRKEFIQANKRK